jgi:cation diffusion facilitator CzcD-associated flavoprotein CzcO
VEFGKFHHLTYVHLSRWKLISRRTQGTLPSGRSGSTAHTALRLVDNEYTSPYNVFCGVAVSSLDSVYPRAKVVEDYLDSFVSHFDLSPNIRLNTTVERLERDETNSFWRVRLSGPGYGERVVEIR